MPLVQEFISLLLLASLVPSRQQSTCQPGPPPTGNCVLPKCRCAYDENSPGNLSRQDTPQMILLTFENAINEANVKNYQDLFTANNPNGCPIRGTFFVQEQFSQVAVLLDLYSSGYELAAYSFNESFPPAEATFDQWKASLAGIRTTLEHAGVKPEDIRGVRGPQLIAGGNNEFMALSQNKFIYDATCVTEEFIVQGFTKWPYTYDYVPTPTCSIGSAPGLQFPGRWQFLIPDLEFNGTKCATPAACRGVNTQKDAFDLFYNSFVKYYDGNRAPFMIVINPEWVTVDYKKAGTVQFLEYLQAAFEDTWIITVSQALDWIQNPTPSSNITNFQPWKC